MHIYIMYITQVVEADNKGYDVPFVVWVRIYSMYDKAAEYTRNFTIASEPACAASHTGILAPAENHPEGTEGWACVGFKVLSYSRKPYKNPHKRTCEVRGQPQLGKTNPCPDILRAVNYTRSLGAPASSLAAEVAPMQGPLVVAQLVDTVLNAWHMLPTPVFTDFPSLPMAWVMQAFVPPDAAAWRARFAADVAAVLGDRFRDTVRVVVIQGPTACPPSAQVCMSGCM